jgi:hypothetical protein
VKAVQQARVYAAAAVQRAARYAAEGGIPYQPPQGYEMQAGYPTVTAAACWEQPCRSSLLLLRMHTCMLLWFIAIRRPGLSSSSLVS